MKKHFFLFLLMVGTATALLAQSDTYRTLNPVSFTELRFNQVRPGYSRVLFEFRMPSSNSKINLELGSIGQLKSLPNLDSLFSVSLLAIKQIIDSTPKDIYARRIDVRPVDNKVEIRMVSNESNQNTLVYQNGNLNNLKLDKDTLRIIFYPQDEQLQYQKYYPAFLSIHVNHLTDLFNFESNSIAPCIALLKKSFNEEFLQKSNANKSYSAVFDMNEQKMIFPNTKMIQKRGNKAYTRFQNNESTILPAIYGSMQFSRGAFVPSFAAGLSYVISDNKYNDHRVFLMWEPYFFFSNTNNQFQTYRNDFVTLRMVEFDKPEKGGWSFVQNVSIGYLAGRRGNWFEPNTFKFSLPGIRNHTLQIEPEFYFNNFFRNFSPTLRLSLFFE
ncbi:MAG TPA: hypothetical protein PL108_00675 [Sediminibacterium sp.]|jgi:hypothetical protein|nr:hypothetical protein [Sediminibacterium sp.]